jgi:hypothetical protein
MKYVKKDMHRKIVDEKLEILPPVKDIKSCSSKEMKRFFNFL